MMVSGGNGSEQMTVPPGFRFHPTEEELLYYYLRKKVSYEAIDLDVIREVDLNKLEPWDLKDKCRIGTGQQDEWYFFSHKDKKYPTGTRTNRATTAGFWKATGRDKSIHMTPKKIGMRKTLVFYTGRAPHGQKTDWIMHEYRLVEDTQDHVLVQEDGWVVCRVFKKKTHNSNDNSRLGFDNSRLLLGFQQSQLDQEDREPVYHHHHQQNQQLDHYSSNTIINNSEHLPLLFSPESVVSVSQPSPFLTPLSLNNNAMDHSTNIAAVCSQNLLSLNNNNNNNDNNWSFLDKLLASNQNMQDYHQHLSQSKYHHQLGVDQIRSSSSPGPKFSFQYLGCETGILKYSK